MSLVNAGALVNVPDHLGLTALHCAASRGNWEVIQTLVVNFEICSSSKSLFKGAFILGWIV